MKKTNYCQSGRSMIEMLGVLAIIGVLSAGGVVGYTIAMTIYKTNKTVELVRNISTSIKTFYGNDFSDMTLAILVELGQISSEYLKINTIGTDNPIGLTPFGTEYTITPSEDAETFSLALQGIPQNACVKLGNHNWGDSDSFVSLTINNNNSSIITSNNQEQNVANMINLCSSADNNSMTWVFK